MKVYTGTGSTAHYPLKAPAYYASVVSSLPTFYGQSTFHLSGALFITLWQQQYTV